MKIFRTTPDNPIVIVDKDEFDRIDTIAKLKEEDVEKLSEEKFLRYVKKVVFKCVYVLMMWIGF